VNRLFATWHMPSSVVLFALHCICWRVEWQISFMMRCNSHMITTCRWWIAVSYNCTFHRDSMTAFTRRTFLYSIFYKINLYTALSNFLSKFSCISMTENRKVIKITNIFLLGGLVLWGMGCVKYFQMTDMEYEWSGSVHPQNTAAIKSLFTFVLWLLAKKSFHQMVKVASR